MTVSEAANAVRQGSARVARPTPEQLDAAILDAAAEVFARHGFTGTSVQQVAEAVGYSKTGLLRRFPTKQALYDGVLAHVGAVVERLLAVADAGAGHGLAEVFRRITDTVFANPGSVTLVLEALRPGRDLPGAVTCQELAHGLVDALTAGLPDPRDQLRAMIALHLIATAALHSIDPETPAVDLTPAQMKDVVTQAALDVLGLPSG